MWTNFRECPNSNQNVFFLMKNEIYIKTTTLLRDKNLTWVEGALIDKSIIQTQIREDVCSNAANYKSI